MGEMKSATKGGSQRRKIEFAKRIVEALTGTVAFESGEGADVLPSHSLRRLSDLFHVRLVLTASIPVVELGTLKPLAIHQ